MVQQITTYWSEECEDVQVKSTLCRSVVGHHGNSCLSKPGEAQKSPHLILLMLKSFKKQNRYDDQLSELQQLLVSGSWVKIFKIPCCCSSTAPRLLLTHGGWQQVR